METGNGSQLTTVAQYKIQLSLSDPNMTGLQSAGMAGLWMTLKQLEKQFPTPAQRPGGLDWSLSSRSIYLNWEGCDLEVLDWLFKQSFQIDSQGLISLIGLNSRTLNLDTQIAIHRGITATFLQHNKFHKSDGKTSAVLEIDGKSRNVQYKGIISYAHQGFAKCLCDKQGQLLHRPIRIAGWLYPGAVISHAIFSETKFEVNPEEALALLFAPVACWYFMLSVDGKSRKVSKQTPYILVVPEILDLAAYAECDWIIRNARYEDFWVAGLGDAGLRFLSLQESIRPTIQDKVRRCQTILFENTPWSSQQMTRTEIKTAEATKDSLDLYQQSYKYFLYKRVYEYKEDTYIATSTIRGMIANNLTQDLPWWFHFAEVVDKDSFGEINSEQEALVKMLEEFQWNDQTKKLFIKACHEALRRIYAKLYGRASEGDSTRIEHRNIRIRSELRRCKNAVALRRFISNFFSEAGQIPTLQDHWEELLPITTGEVDWQLTRDLMLFAMSSYKKNVVPRDGENSQTSDLQNLGTG